MEKQRFNPKDTSDFLSGVVISLEETVDTYFDEAADITLFTGCYDYVDLMVNLAECVLRKQNLAPELAGMKNKEFDIQELFNGAIDHLISRAALQQYVDNADPKEISLEKILANMNAIEANPEAFETVIKTVQRTLFLQCLGLKPETKSKVETQLIQPDYRGKAYKLMMNYFSTPREHIKESTTEIQ
jgi:hypothetical protein